MKAGGLQAKLVPWALAVGAPIHARKDVRTAPVAGCWPLTTRSPIKLVLHKVRDAAGTRSHPVLRERQCGAARRYGDDVPGTGRSDHARVRAHRNVAGDHRKPAIFKRIRRRRKPDFRRRGANRAGRRDPHARSPRDARLLSRSRRQRRPSSSTAGFTPGDIGEIDAAGFLRITDRKREVFKTDTGKWISPARVEGAIKRSAFVSQAMVVGSGRPHPAALVCPNWDLVRIELALPADASSGRLGTAGRRESVRDGTRGKADARARQLRAGPPRRRHPARVQRRKRRAFAVDEDQAARRRGSLRARNRRRVRASTFTPTYPLDRCRFWRSSTCSRQPARRAVRFWPLRGRGRSSWMRRGRRFRSILTIRPPR